MTETALSVAVDRRGSLCRFVARPLFAGATTPGSDPAIAADYARRVRRANQPRVTALSTSVRSRVPTEMNHDPPLGMGGAGAAGSIVPPGRQLKVAERPR